MIVLPFSADPRSYDIFIVLEIDQIDRIQRYDPAHFDVTTLPAEFRHKRLRQILVGFATPQDIQRLVAWCNNGAAQEALRYLSRGFEFRPDLGDHDGPPVSLMDKGEPTQ